MSGVRGGCFLAALVEASWRQPGGAGFEGCGVDLQLGWELGLRWTVRTGSSRLRSLLGTGVWDASESKRKLTGFLLKLTMSAVSLALHLSKRAPFTWVRHCLVCTMRRSVMRPDAGRKAGIALLDAV